MKDSEGKEVSWDLFLSSDTVLREVSKGDGVAFKAVENLGSAIFDRKEINPSVDENITT
jgi:hypothetical protein